jgi:prepilin-type processing-associated H-X9-DG protein
MLLPALAKAKAKAIQAKCTNNLKQITLGVHMYADDNRDFYCAFEAWCALGGNTGKIDFHGGFTPVTRRPLNRYVPAKEAFFCPGDKGDALYPDLFNKNVRSTYEAWGNSYLSLWSVDTLRAQHVFGDSLSADPTRRSMKLSEVAKSPVNKLITGDWPWWPDRPKSHPMSAWHGSRGKYKFDVLFGDGHVQYFSFPLTATNWNYTGPPPDPNFTWW